jgi:hypothetical protein
VTRAACAVLAASSLLLGCGSNAPEVPKDLLVTDSGGCVSPDYPSEGFGKEPGGVVANLCFVGYRAPDRVAPTPEHRETIAFSDYYDPAGTKGVSLLLINTSAVWCTACIDEHRTLPDHAAELAPQGLVVLSTLFQDAKREEPSFEDLERWIANFHTNFPMVADPEIQLEGYASSDSAPLNLVVDPRNMKILRKYVGNQGTLWPFIESELKARSADR